MSKAQYIQANKDWLVAKSKEDGVKSLPKGIYYKVLGEGNARYRMTDFDSIWRTQDEIRTVVNAVLGECIWNLSFNEKRMAIELELTITLDDDAINNLSCQFPITADYDGLGARGSKFAFFL